MVADWEKSKASLGSQEIFVATVVEIFKIDTCGDIEAMPDKHIIETTLVI